MSDKTEPLSAILAEMRLDADILVFPTLTPDKLRTYADRIEAAVKREREETKDYFAKLHDGPSMICTAKNCSLRNAAEDIVEQVKDEASFGHFAPVVVEDRPVGNAAAVREALENVERVARFCAEAPRHTPAYPTDAARADVLYSRIAELGRVARAALASPARNCDRFATVGAAHKAWRATDQERDFADWLFDKAEGGAE